jgi:hypothetical protein
VKQQRDRSRLVAATLRAFASDPVRASTALDRALPLPLADTWSAEARATSRTPSDGASVPRPIRQRG